VSAFVAACRAATWRLPLLLETSLLRVAIPQENVAAVRADKIDVLEWKPRVH
jgi:hypothetical protein